MKDTKVIFFGTPTFCVPILEKLIEECNVTMVVTQPDKEIGRKRILTPSPIKEVALKNNIKVFTPEKIRNDFDEVLKENPDIIITCAYGQIMPKEILECPKFGCINVHASLLPKYRGGAPIQRSIINGDKKTGITIMYMDVGMDTGDMISKEEVIIEENDNYDSLCEKLKEAGVKILFETLPKILNGTNNREKQDENEVSFANIITREDEYIDFNKKSIDIYNQVRGLSSIPGCFANLDGKAIKIYACRMSNDNSNKKIGEIINIYKDGIGVKTLDGEIIITDLKIEGKNRVLAKDYLNGIKKEELIGKVFNNYEG